MGFALVLVLALGFFAAPVAAEAQQAGKMHRIGYLGAALQTWKVFVQQLRDLGWVEGKNIEIERRYSEGRYERYPNCAFR